MRSIPGQGNALETEPSFDDAACCPFESFYRANRNEKQPDYQYHCAYLPVLGICCTFDIKSDMRMVLALLTSLRSFSSFWHGITRKRSLLVLRASVDIKSTEKIIAPDLPDLHMDITDAAGMIFCLDNGFLFAARQM